MNSCFAMLAIGRKGQLRSRLNGGAVEKRYWDRRHHFFQTANTSKCERRA